MFGNTHQDRHFRKQFTVMGDMLMRGSTVVANS